jgi:hypothetical protein
MANHNKYIKAQTATKLNSDIDKDYMEFTEIDPYNPQNKVSGYVCRKATEYYGSLIITHVNGIEVSGQLIMGTPCD